MNKYVSTYKESKTIWLRHGLLTKLSLKFSLLSYFLPATIMVISFMQSNLISAITLSIAVIFAFLVGFSVVKREHQLALLFAVIFLTPTLSIPLADLFELDLGNDLAQYRVRFKAIFLLILCITYWPKRLSKSNKILNLSFAFIVFSIILKWIVDGNPEKTILGLSMDLSYCFPVFVFSNIKKGFVWEIFNRAILRVFQVFILFMFIDLGLTYSEIFPWSVSWRGGMSGVFYANEVPYSLAIGYAFVFLMHQKRFGLFTIPILALMLWSIALTNIKTTVLATVIVYVSFVIFGKNRLAVKYRSVFINLSIVFVFLFMRTTDSILTRLGTYSIYWRKLMDGNVMTGLSGGEFSIWDGTPLMAKNLFSEGYTNYIKTSERSTIMFSEYLERSNYDVGGEFLPHNSFLLVLFSFGILSIPFIYRIFRNAIGSVKHTSIYSSLLVLNIIFSFFHPMIIVGEILILSLIIKSQINEKQRWGMADFK